MVVVQEQDAVPGEIYETYVDLDCSKKEEAEQHFYTRLFMGEFPSGCTAFIYECSLVSMVGGQGPQP